jgi:opacity protein-like surface antigen
MEKTMNLNKRRTTLQRKSAITLALATALAAGSATAADTWYVGATGGLTNNGVSSLNLTTDGVDGRATADADNGYTMGAVFGREFDSRWRLEGEFRYRTNEFASVDLPDGSRITDGDFSSGALGVNGYWLFGEVDAAWRPFVGAGLAWMQEIDLDLADDPVNGSYSGDGTAWQLMGGVTWAPSDRWRFDFEARYLDAGSVAMDSERGALGGRIDADYSLFEVTAEATYRF